MSEVLNFHEVVCPNCKTPITKFNEFDSKVTCKACGHSFVATGSVLKQGVQPERIIPFTTKIDDFQNFVVNTLINSPYVPVDIFEKISFTDKLHKMYLPMFLYEGRYEATYNCEVASIEKQVSYSSDKDGGTTKHTNNVKKWRPQSGSTKGNFNLLCIAHTGDVPAELENFTRAFNYEAKFAVNFKPSFFEGDNDLEIKECNEEAENIWFRNGDELVKDLAYNHALAQLSGEIRNFNASSSYEPTTPAGRLVYVPFWFTYFEYEGKTYYIMMDGLGHANTCRLPEDEARIKRVNRWETIRKIFKWGKWAALLLIFVPHVPWDIVIILFAALWITQFVMKFVGNSQKKKIINEGVEARRLNYQQHIA